MFGGGKSMGGGGGGMLRTVGRVVTRAGVANLQEPMSASSSNSTTTSPTAKSWPTQNRNDSANQLSLSAAVSSPFSSHNVPVYANSGAPSWPYFSGGGAAAAAAGSCCDECEWISVDESEDEKSNGYFVNDFVLGPVPSLDEVKSAVSALQLVFAPSSYAGLVRDKFASDSDKDAELDWMEPSLHLRNPRMLQPYGYDTVYDAFHLLQSEPTVQRMVISLSSDKAVWNAVWNNEVVRELKESLYAAEKNGSESSDESSEDSNPAINAIRWIFNNTKAKVMEVIDKITNVVNELFKPPDDRKAATGAATTGATGPFKEKLRTSLLLSIVVLLVVVVSRANRA